MIKNGLIIRVKRKREEDPVEEIFIEGNPTQKKRKLSSLMEELSIHDDESKDFEVFKKIEVNEESEMDENKLQRQTIKKISQMSTKKRRENNRLRKFDSKINKIKKKRLVQICESRVFGGDNEDGLLVIDFDTWMAHLLDDNDDKSKEKEILCERKQNQKYVYNYYIFHKKITLKREDYKNIESYFIFSENEKLFGDHKYEDDDFSIYEGNVEHESNPNKSYPDEKKDLLIEVDNDNENNNEEIDSDEEEIVSFQKYGLKEKFKMFDANLSRHEINYESDVDFEEQENLDDFLGELEKMEDVMKDDLEKEKDIDIDMERTIKKKEDEMDICE